MQELTRIALLAEPAQPVLAHGREAFALARVRGQLLGWLEVERGGLGVSEGAMQGSQWAACGREREPAYLIICVRCKGVDEMRCTRVGRGRVYNAPLSSLIPSSLLMYDSSAKLFWWNWGRMMSRNAEGPASGLLAMVVMSERAMSGHRG